MQHDTARSFAAVGDIVTIEAGDHLIQVQQVGPAAYRVEVLARGFVATTVDDLTASWATPELALSHADTLAKLFLAESEPAPVGPRQPTPRVSKPGVGLIGYISEPVFRALDVAARDGRVYRGGGQDQAIRSVLESAAKDKLLTLTPKPGSRAGDYAYGELTETGRTVLAGERALREREAAKAGAR